MLTELKEYDCRLDKLWNDLDAMGGGEGSGETPAAAISAPVTSSAPAITTETVEGGKGQNGSKADYSKNAKDAQDAMDFLDELSQRSSTPITLPSHATQVPARKSLEASRPNSRGSFRDTTTPQPPASSQKQSQGSWGWSSVWSQASTVLQQAKQTAEENLAHISHQTPTEGSDQARKWTEHMLGYVKQHTHGLDVDKLRESGSKAFMDVLNAVAPPIAEHTVVQVYLSHDMVGYEGVETLTYRALAKVNQSLLYPSIPYSDRAYAFGHR